MPEGVTGWAAFRNPGGFIELYAMRGAAGAVARLKLCALIGNDRRLRSEAEFLLQRLDEEQCSNLPAWG